MGYHNYSPQAVVAVDLVMAETVNLGLVKYVEVWDGKVQGFSG